MGGIGFRWKAALCGVALAVRATAADLPSSPQAAVDQIKMLLEEIEKWTPPDRAALTQACAAAGAERPGTKAPPLPEKEAKELEGALAERDQAVRMLCGKGPQCAPGAPPSRWGACTAGSKLLLTRSALQGKSEDAICERFLKMDTDTPLKASPAEIKSVCALVRDAIPKWDGSLCAHPEFGRAIGGGGEAGGAECRFFFRALKGAAECSNAKGYPVEKTRARIGMELEDCRTWALGYAALRARDPKLCQGNRLCLAAAGDPQGCAEPPARNAIELLLAPDSKGCEGDGHCIELHRNTRVFRDTIQEHRRQSSIHCSAQASGGFEKAREDRQNSLLQAETMVKKFSGVPGFTNIELRDTALKRIGELSRQAIGLPKVEVKQDAPMSPQGSESKQRGSSPGQR